MLYGISGEEPGSGLGLPAGELESCAWSWKYGVVPQPAEQIAVESGHSLSVGRTSRADLVFADDNHMSGVHFVVVCDDRGCLVRDLNSSNGTLLNGTKVGTAPLQRWRYRSPAVRPRSWCVWWTSGSPSRQLRLRRWRPPLPPTPQAKLLAMLREEFQPLYALLDAAIEPDVLKVIVESKEEYQSLYRGSGRARSLRTLRPTWCACRRSLLCWRFWWRKAGAKAGEST